MSEALNHSILNLSRSIHIIAQQEIPVLPTSPVYRLFEVRKQIAVKILRDELNSQEEYMLVELIDSYNSNIKQYLVL